MYKNKELAIKALTENLPVWGWSAACKGWMLFGISTMIESESPVDYWAVGEKPTKPPRKSRILINGISFPAPILEYEDLPDPYWSVGSGTALSSPKLYGPKAINRVKIGNSFATEAEAEETIELRKKLFEEAAK